jgi:tyrosinase
MPYNGLRRREFLKTASATVALALGGVKRLDAASYVRRDIGGLSATDPVIMSYRKAVRAMMALPPSDPLSWVYQAAIHGTLSMQMPVPRAWNTCEHGTRWFWPWHRMYLYWFERIVRTMSGDSTWALPYWNYSSSSERQLPAAFRDPTSELYTTNRGSGWNDGTASFPASDVDFTSGFSMLNFDTASSALEQRPHNAVHVDIGGLMGSVPTAAQDPIFYLHHSNIDRLWNLWLAQGNKRADPVLDNIWTQRQFPFFDENSSSVVNTSCDVLRAALQLNYTYEGEPSQVNSFCGTRPDRWYFSPFTSLLTLISNLVLAESDSTVRLPINEGFRDQLINIAQSSTETLYLQFNGVQTDNSPGVVWEVYVGAPLTETRPQPDPENPFFVGNLALFGAGVRSDAHMGMGFSSANIGFEVNNAILAWAGTNQNDLPVRFISHGPLINGQPTQPPQPQSTVQLGPVEMAVQRRFPDDPNAR